MKSCRSRPSSPPMRGENSHDNNYGLCPSPRFVLQFDSGCSRPSAHATSSTPTDDPRLANAPIYIALLLQPLEYDERAAWAASLQLAPYRHALNDGDAQVSAEDLGCLRGGDFLCDAVIIAFSELLNARHRATRTASAASPTKTGRVHVFSTFIYSFLLRQSYSFARVRVDGRGCH